MSFDEESDATFQCIHVRKHVERFCVDALGIGDDFYKEFFNL